MNQAQHTFHCQASQAQSGLPFAKGMAKRFPYLEEQEWRQLIAAGQVLLNGAPAHPDRALTIGDTVTSIITGFEEPTITSKIATVYEDQNFLLVDKPAGLPVSRTGRIVTNTLINLLRRQHRNPEIQLMHRLDRETGGLLLCARSSAACKRWQRHLHEILCRKFYLAVVCGRLELANHVVEAPLAERDDSPVRCQMHVEASGKPAATTFHTLAASDFCSLLLVEPHTGRKHQIRAHLAHLGHPLFGDKIYAHDGHYFLARLERELTEADYQVLGATNHTLHAWSLELHLPDREPTLFFSECFSEDMERYLEGFPDWLNQGQSTVDSLRSLPRGKFTLPF